MDHTNVGEENSGKVGFYAESRSGRSAPPVLDP
jgi:hypothetical protein